MRKLNNGHGETLVEVLISIIILSLCFVILQTSIVASARMNKQSKDGIIPFIADKANGEYKTITIERNGQSSSAQIFQYHTTEGYYYYD